VNAFEYVVAVLLVCVRVLLVVMVIWVVVREVRRSGKTKKK
jgi:predicted small integral membrane protein